MFGLFKKIKSALTKTRSFLGSKIKALFSGPLDAETLDQLENILYQADIGSRVTQEFVDDIKAFLKKNPNPTPDEILAA
jgi:fused signal recognition particle receptor